MDKIGTIFKERFNHIIIPGKRNQIVIQIKGYTKYVKNGFLEAWKYDHICSIGIKDIQGLGSFSFLFIKYNQIAHKIKIPPQVLKNISLSATVKILSRINDKKL